MRIAPKETDGPDSDSSLHKLRLDAAERGQWNIGFFASGAIFWMFATAAGAYYPLSEARIFWLVGSFIIFPVAVGISYLLRADPFTKGNPLGELVGYTHMSVITMTFPLVIAAFIFHPEALLLVMAIAYCLDFYVMSWAFNTALFGIHAAVRTIIVSLVWFAIPEWRFSILPAAVAALYVVTVILIPVLRRRWIREARLVAAER